MTQEHPVPHLRRLREDAGLTQKQLASMAGVSEHAVYLFERGANAPSLATAQAMARALSTTVSAILGETTEVQP